MVSDTRTTARTMELQYYTSIITPYFLVSKPRTTANVAIAEVVDLGRYKATKAAKRTPNEVFNPTQESALRYVKVYSTRCRHFEWLSQEDRVRNGRFYGCA